MGDERDELTAAQVILNAALALNEAAYELMSLAQLNSYQLRQLVDASSGEGPITSAAVDKIAAALEDLGYLDKFGAIDGLRKAADEWTHGEGPTATPLATPAALEAAAHEARSVFQAIDLKKLFASDTYIHAIVRHAIDSLNAALPAAAVAEAGE
jgi:hypothetical protein